MGNNVKTAAVELLKVRSLLTLVMIGTMCAMVVMNRIDSAAFMGLAGSVVTYYFQRKEGRER